MRQSEDTTLGPEDDAEAGRAGQEHEETPDQPAQQHRDGDDAKALMECAGVGRNATRTAGRHIGQRYAGRDKRGGRGGRAGGQREEVEATGGELQAWVVL
eukprot:575505-Rhodomonas_salina.1